MKTLAVLALSLVCCGRSHLIERTEPLLYLDHIDSSILVQTWAIAHELNELAGSDLVHLEPNTKAYSVHSDLKALADLGQAQRKPYIGLCDLDKHVINVLSADSAYFYDGGMAYLLAADAKANLAHELGHAMGLHHVDHGLMTPNIQDEHCRGIEAQCLLAALIEQGKL